MLYGCRVHFMSCCAKQRGARESLCKERRAAGGAREGAGGSEVESKGWGVH